MVRHELSRLLRTLTGIMLVGLAFVGTEKPALSSGGECHPISEHVLVSIGRDGAVVLNEEVFLNGIVMVENMLIDCDTTEREVTDLRDISWVSLPGGNVATLFDADTMNPHFKADTLGTYWLRVTGKASYFSFLSHTTKTVDLDSTIVITVGTTRQDLYIFGIEVTQATQTSESVRTSFGVGAVPLVEHKRTIVRVYPGLFDADLVSDVEAKLQVFRDGVELLPGPIPLVTPQRINVKRSGSPSSSRGEYDALLYALRAGPKTSFDFVLQDSQTSGEITLVATINPDGKIDETPSGLLNSRDLKVKFTRKPALPLGIVPIHYKRGGLDLKPVTTIPSLQMHWLQSTFPRYKLDWWTMPKLEVNYSLTCDSSWIPWRHECLEDLLDDIEDLTDCDGYFCSGYLVEEQPPHFYGLVPAGTPINRKGFANLNLVGDPEPAALGIESCPGPDPGSCWGGYPGEQIAGEVMAQEIAHNYGRAHICSPGGGEDNCESGAPGGIIGELGFDVRTNTVVPFTAFDFMTYQNGNLAGMWVGPHTYTGLLSGSISASLFALAGGPLQEQILVGGRVSPTNGKLRPMYRFGRSFDPYPSTPGHYSIELWDDVNARTLYLWSFEPVPYSKLPEEIGNFRAYLPWQPGTTHIRLKRGSDVLQTVPVSPHTPTVSLIAPIGGSELTGTTLVKWSATDADGGELTAMIQYSRDGGQRWSPVAVSIQESEYELDTASLGASDNAYLRVLVTDRVNTGIAMVGPVKVADKAPQVAIAGLLDGVQIEQGTAVPLQAFAFDVDNGSGVEPGLSWESDLSGPLGNGAVLDTSVLAPGRQVVSVKAQDGGGQISTDQRTVTVIPVLPAPEQVTLDVNALEGDSPISVPIQVIGPRRTIDWKAPLNIAFQLGAKATLRAPAGFTIGGRTLRFIGWRSNGVILTVDNQLVVTLHGARTLEAIYVCCADGPDLALTKELKPGQPTPQRGGTLSFLIKVRNIGNVATPATPTIVTLRDELPAGTTFVFWSILRGTGRCTSSPPYVDCDLGASWSPGSGATVEIRIRLPNRGGTFVNRANVDVFDRVKESNETNNSTSLSLTIP